MGKLGVQMGAAISCEEQGAATRDCERAHRTAVAAHEVTVPWERLRRTL